MTEREQFLSDVLTTAVEGGINYWAAVSDYKWYEGDFRAIPASVKVHEIDDDPADVSQPYFEVGVPITTKEIGAAIARIMNPNDEIKHLNPYVRSLVFQASMENDAGDIDTDIADTIMQIAVLGGVIYG
jgi:hypothetical protein